MIHEPTRNNTKKTREPYSCLFVSFRVISWVVERQGAGRSPQADAARALAATES